MTTVHEQAHERIRGFRQYLHREPGERVWSVGGALRVHLNNFSVDALKDYIALSRHQFELIEFVTQRTGMDTGEPVKFEVMNWSTGKPDIWIDRGKPRTDEVPEWELEMLEDMAWRAQAMGRSLSRFEQNMTISTPADLMELSRHQCEMLNFLKTGSFRKVPGRRKARTISGGGATSDSGERIKILGEALKEYQGRIEIKTVREFIALSKHQCELAGLLFAEAESGQPVFQVVGYEEAYGLKGEGNPAEATQKTWQAWQASGVAGDHGYPHTSLPLVVATLREDSLREGGGSGGVGTTRSRGDWINGSPRHEPARTGSLTTSPQSPAVSARARSYRDAHDKGGEVFYQSADSRSSSVALSIHDRAIPKKKCNKPDINPPSMKVKTFPVFIEGEVQGEEGETEPHALLQMGLRADRAKQYFRTGTGRDGRFTHSVDIETDPGGADRVVVWGRAIDRIMSMPLPFARITVKIRSDEFDKLCRCETNGSGEFSHTFEPDGDEGFP